MITDQEIEQEAHNRFPNAIISGKPEEINFEYHWSLRATENRKIFRDSVKWVISKLSGKVVKPEEDMVWYGNRKGMLYFIEDPNAIYGKWFAMGDMIDTSKSYDENEAPFWTNDPNAALAWKSREGAEIHIKKSNRWGLGYIVTEHEFIDMPPQMSVQSKALSGTGGMRGWVKASERLPKPSELGFFKENITCKWITESGKLISGMRSAEGVAYNKLDPTFYWLDESDQIAGSEKYALDAVILIKQILRDDVHIILGDLIDNAVNKALKPQPITNLKTAEEVLKPFIEIPFRYTRIVSEENALKAMEIYLNQSKGISPDNIDGIIRRTHES